MCHLILINNILILYYLKFKIKNKYMVLPPKIKIINLKGFLSFYVVAHVFLEIDIRLHTETDESETWFKSWSEIGYNKVD